MASQSHWTDRIYEVDPTFVSTGGDGQFASTGETMRATSRGNGPDEAESLDPMAVLRKGIDEYLATGSADLGLFRRLRDSMDDAGERGSHARAAMNG